MYHLNRVCANETALSTARAGGAGRRTGVSPRRFEARMSRAASCGSGRVCAAPGPGPHAPTNLFAVGHTRRRRCVAHTRAPVGRCVYTAGEIRRRRAEPFIPIFEARIDFSKTSKHSRRATHGVVSVRLPRALRCAALPVPAPHAADTDSTEVGATEHGVSTRARGRWPVPCQRPAPPRTATILCYLRLSHGRAAACAPTDVTLTYEPHRSTAYSTIHSSQALPTHGQERRMATEHDIPGVFLTPVGWGDRQFSSPLILFL